MAIFTIREKQSVVFAGIFAVLPIGIAGLIGYFVFYETAQAFGAQGTTAQTLGVVGLLSAMAATATFVGVVFYYLGQTNAPLM